MVQRHVWEGEAKGLAKGEARHSIRLAMRKLLENRSASEVAEDLYLDTDEIRSIKKAMEALHITCVDEETATCVCAGLDAAHQVKIPLRILAHDLPCHIF